MTIKTRDELGRIKRKYILSDGTFYPYIPDLCHCKEHCNTIVYGGREFVSGHNKSTLGTRATLITKERQRRGHLGRVSSLKGKKSGKPSPMKGKKHKPESIKLIKQNRRGKCRGKDNHFYINGCNILDYPEEFDEILREEIRIRDNYICQLCGRNQTEELSEYEQKLSIHHIDKNKFNSNKNNLISLCIRCHSKINYTPKYFEHILKFQTGINNMCILSNEDIKECIDLRVLNIYGMNEKTIRENGLDFTLSGTYAIESETYKEEIVDLHNQDVNRFSVIKSDGKFILYPNQFMLLSTREIISVPNNIMGFCAIRSTVARNGILCPQTVLDCGFSGALTIEVYNGTKKQIILTEGDRFLHVVLSFTKTPSSIPYSGVYNNQKIVTPPKRSIE